MCKIKHFLLLLIPLLFANKVYASEIEMYQNNNNGSLSDIGYKECILSQCWSKQKGVKYDGQLYSLNFYSGVPISPLDKYTLTIRFRGDDFISSKANDVYVYNDTSCSIINTQTDGNSFSTYLKISFVCGQSSTWFGVKVGGLGEEPITGGPISGATNYGVNGIDIVNETAKDTDKIIASNDKNTDNIINNNNNNTNNIIDNNNANTDKIIESNKENFNTCRDSVNLFDKNTMIEFVGKFRNWDNGVVTENSSFVGIKVPVEPNSTYSVSSNLPRALYSNLAFFSNDKYLSGSAFTSGSSFTTPENCNYITLAIKNTYTWLQIQNGSSITSYEPFGEICVNKLDEQNKTSKGILSKITSIFDWLTNKDSADLSGANNIVGYLPAGPLDSIINLPLTFLQNFNTNLSKTCTPLDVPIPYLNKTIQIPCIDTIFNQIDGLPNLWNWVGTIMSIFILYRYLIALYKYYDDLTTLKANFMSDWGSI